MKFKSYTGITWSILELEGLLEDEDSNVYFEKFKKHLGLHPFHLTNLNAALNEILSSNLNAYDAELKGFLLAYKNPKLLTPLGEIFYDTCFIHVDIEADFYIFRPEVGCTLKGIVNKKGLDHIGVLVHKAFNVSIPKPDDDENWPGESLEIGQEIRFAITLLDFTCKLPFIRGLLNPDEYLQGCKLMEKSIKNKKRSPGSNFENSIEKGAKKGSKKGARDAKNHTFFATDSENTSDEDKPHIEQKYVQQKKSKKKHETGKIIGYNEETKDDKKPVKKHKEGSESKHKLIKVETAHDQFLNNNSVNGDCENSGMLELTSAKNRVGKKFKALSSQSSLDDDCNNIKSGRCGQKRMSKKLLVAESSDAFSTIKLEHRAASSDIEQVAEENVDECKYKIKKLLLKRKHSDDSDTSVADFTPDKYIKSLNSPSKKSSRRNKTAPVENEETPIYIKSEQLSNTSNSNINSDVQETPKKKHKKHKHSLKVEISENEDTDIGESPIRKRSKKSSMLDSRFEFQNTTIKKEKVTGSFESIKNEYHTETNKIPEGDSEPNMYAHSSSYDLEEGDESSATKKKRKKHSKKSLIDISEIKVEPAFEDTVIKVESAFEDTVIKVEELDHVHDDNIIEETDSMGNIPKISSLKKEHQSEMLNNMDNEDEVDVKSNAKRSKKKTGDKEACRSKEKTQGLAMDNGSDVDISDASLRASKKKRKRSKTSPHKRSSKSTKSESDVESEFDFREVKIKTEKFPNS